MRFWKMALFPFSGSKYLTWWTPHIKLLSFTGHHRNDNLLRYVPENRSSPWAITGKWLLIKLTSRLKNTTWIK
jgi:hypothetical protein